jgi:hypothetical protein
MTATRQFTDYVPQPTVMVGAARLGTQIATALHEAIIHATDLEIALGKQDAAGVTRATAHLAHTAQTVQVLSAMLSKRVRHVG